MSVTVPKSIDGYYRYTDVVDQIAKTYNLSAEVAFELSNAMARSINNRELVSRNTKNGLPILKPDQPSVYVTELDAKKWLQDMRLPYSWNPNKPSRPLSVPLMRQKLILEKISELGHDPQKLPDRKPGKSGVKKEVRSALGTKDIWTGDNVFDDAWEELRKSGEIAGG